MIYQRNENGVVFNETDTTLNWKLIYPNDKGWGQLIQTSGVTSSINIIEEFTTEEEALARVEELGINLS